jgi:hypothetical protein
MNGIDTRQESGDGMYWDKKRQEIALRVLRRGHNPDFVSELSRDGLAELERRLKEVELAEETQRSQSKLDWFISRLLRDPAKRREHRLPLRCDGLAKDPLREREARKATLERECNQLTIQLRKIDDQIQVVMRYEDSEEQVARLRDSKARVEKELTQKQADLARLSGQIGAQC